MSSTIVRLTYGVAALALLVSAGPALAQNGIAFASLQIQLWPEYDQPKTLVILDGRLDTNVTLPAELTLRIPAAAGQPNAVAVRGLKGDLLSASYTTTLSGGDLAITFKTDSAEVYIEYYDPALTLNGSTRDYTFQWKPDYPVRAATVRVQQPFGASEMNFKPTLKPIGPGNDGLNYYEAPLGSVSAGQAVTLRLGYVKTDPKFSAEAVGTSASASVFAPAEQPAPTSPFSTALPIGLAGVLLIVGGGIYYGYTRRAMASTRVKTHNRKRKRHEGVIHPAVNDPLPARPRAASAIAEANAPDRYCVQCGRALLAGDQFCRNCGTKARQQSG